MNTKTILSLLVLSASLILSFHSKAEDASLLDIMPGEELKLNFSFPKSVYKQNPIVVFRNGQVDSPVNRDPYQIGEYCEVYFHRDPSSMFRAQSTCNEL